MKKIIFVLFVLLFSFWIAWANDLKDALVNQPGQVVSWLQNGWDWISMLDNILKFIKDSISGLLLVVVLWVFIFIWTRLFVARWNPEEFKKAMMHFVYAVVWIFVISIAWAVVKMVSGISI